MKKSTFSNLFSPYAQKLFGSARHACVRCLALLALMLAPALSIQADDDITTLTTNIRQGLVSSNGNAAASTIKGYMDDMGTDGRWSDIDLTLTTQTSWKPINHLNRLISMAGAYVNSSNSYYGNATLYDKIVLGLQAWCDAKPKSTNWWNQCIATPQALGKLLILMMAGRQTLPTTLQESAISIMQYTGTGANQSNDPKNYTGANRTDVALHWIYRGCIRSDASVLTYAFGYFYEPISYTTKEGFQVDGSYWQHGSQLYLSGYAESLLTGVLPIAIAARGTAYALTQDQISLLSNYVLNTYAYIARGRSIAYDCSGRGFTRGGPFYANSSYFTLLETLDPTNRQAYETARLRLSGQVSASYRLTPYHVHFFRGDYTMHIRPSYNYNVRISSTRTTNCEVGGNDENLKGYYIGQGDNVIHRTGQEYLAIFPLWNWSRIPGTTEPVTSTFPPVTLSSKWGVTGTSTFAGGVSDSVYGVTVFKQKERYQSTSSNKGWFFFDDEIVCLGSGIKSNARTYTTVDQCYGGTTFTMGKTDGSTLTLTTLNNKTVRDTCAWLLNNSVGYYFPMGARLSVSNQDVTGNWKNINKSYTNDASGRVFTVAIDHSIPRTKAASYAYIVVPAKTLSSMASYVAQGNIDCIINTDSVQAVHNKKLDMWQMIFYRAASVDTMGVQLAVSRPCALMFSGTDSRNVALHIADPAQARANIDVNIKTPGLGVNLLSATAPFSSLTNEYAGQTLVLNFEHQSAPVGIKRVNTAAWNGLKVTTNPSTLHAGESFTLTTDDTVDGKVLIYATTGSLVASVPLTNGIAEAALAQSGVYIVRVIAGGQTSSSKIIVR